MIPKNIRAAKKNLGCHLIKVHKTAVDDDGVAVVEVVERLGIGAIAMHLACDKRAGLAARLKLRTLKWNKLREECGNSVTVVPQRHLALQPSQINTSQHSGLLLYGTA
jgi:hypothetical protein